jgi:hypothetical protein
VARLFLENYSAKLLSDGMRMYVYTRYGPSIIRGFAARARPHSAIYFAATCDATKISGDLLLISSIFSQHGVAAPTHRRRAFVLGHGVLVSYGEQTMYNHCLLLSVSKSNLKSMWYQRKFVFADPVVAEDHTDRTR